MPTAVGTVMLLCLIPVGTMITGSIVVTFFQPGPKLTSAMQHFAAGIVLAAVAIELAPQLAIRIHGQNGVFTIAMLLGFFFAIGVLMLISRYFDADDDDEDEGKKDDEVVKKKEPETFTSNPALAAVSSPTSAINLDIGSNKTTSTAYSSPVASPRSPMGGPSSLDVNSVNVAMPGAAPGETDGRWNNNQQPGYGNNNNNNNNWNNNNNNNNWNNNNPNGRNRDESFPSQVDHIQYGARNTMDNGYGNRGTMDGGYGNRGTMDGGYGAGYGRQSTIGEGSDVSASSYSNNSQAPLTRAPNSSMSNMRGNMAGAPPRYGGNQGGYGNNGGYNNNGNNYGRAPYPPPPGPPSMPEPEGDWNGNNNWNNNNNNRGGGYGNNNWNNNMYNNQRGENMYNNQNWNTRTRQRGQSTHTWQPRVRYAAQWKNQGRSDMGYVPPPPPRRNGGNQWGNSVRGNQWNNNGQQNWNNTNRTMDQTHARMPSYMLHGSATTGLAKSMARNSFKASSPPTIATTGPVSFINTDLAKKPAAAPVGAFNIPWGLIVAVAVDASTDGILIGIASAVGQGGIIIAIALSIEMSFLGISTSVEMNEMNVPKNIQIPLLMVLPGFILVGGAIGATVMAGVGGALFVSFLGFGTAALLFLVVEELLISAHEDLAHDTWYVSICLFVGFMVVLIMDQFSGPNMCIDVIAAEFAKLNLDDNGKQIPGTKVLTMG